MNSTVDHSVTVDIGGYALSNGLAYQDGFTQKFSQSQILESKANSLQKSAYRKNSAANNGGKGHTQNTNKNTKQITKKEESKNQHQITMGSDQTIQKSLSEVPKLKLTGSSYLKNNINHLAPNLDQKSKKPEHSRRLTEDHDFIVLKNAQETQIISLEDGSDDLEFHHNRGHTQSIDELDRKLQLNESEYSRYPKVASKFQKLYMYQSVKRGIQDHERRGLWLLSTGALNAMYSCHASQSYWQLIKHFNREFPNPNFYQIKVDLPRTFQEEPFYQQPQVMKSIENILQAYAVRNPTIGYCQGFNFVVGRLLRVVSEEEAFWMFCQIIETIMPLDYYSNMVGALIDQKVFSEIFQSKFPDLFMHLQDLGQQIFKEMEDFPKLLTNPEILFQTANMKKYKVKNYDLQKMRNEKRKNVLQEIQGYQQELKECINAKINRIKFLNKFYLYTGIAKTVDKSTNFDINKSECVEALRCERKWPVCLFDFTYKNKVPEFFVFRVDQSSYQIRDNYFYPEEINTEEFITNQFAYRKQSSSSQDALNEEQENELTISPPNYKNGPPPNQNQNQFLIDIENQGEADLMIERNHHFCSNKSISLFKRLIRKNEIQMYSSDTLNFSITDEVTAQKQIRAFVGQVKKINEDNDQIQSLIKTLKRSNSDYLKFRPLSSRMRAYSGEDQAEQPQSKVSKTPYQNDFRLRTKSGIEDLRTRSRSKINMHEYKGDNGNLQTCTIAYLFRNLNRQQLESYFKDMKARGIEIFESFLKDFDDQQVIQLE